MCIKTAVFALIAAFTATATWAELARVNSGEHAGFSRLVIELGTPAEWELGRVDQGYELRADVEDLAFDTRQVFDFIPQDRITGFQQPQPGRLVILTECDCYADAFEMSRGRIVLDIRDGKAPAYSAYEMPLGPLTYAQADLSDSGVGPTLISPARDPSTEIAPLFLRPPAPRTPAPMPENSDPPVESRQIPALFPETPAIPDSPVSELPALTATRESMLQVPDPAPVTAEVDIAPMAPLQLQQLPVKSLFGDQFRNLAVPEILTQPPSEDDRARVEQAQSALVQQLQKAVAQGLISIPQSEISVPQIAPDPAETTPVEPAPLEQENPDSGIEHVFVETAADRDAINPVVQALRRNAIENCLPPELFDVANWGPEDMVGNWFDDIRAGLVGEFDLPREDLIIKMARRYLYFGYGAETLNLLDGFEIHSREAAIIRELAGLVDEVPDSAHPIVESQAPCSTPAAIWSMLAQDEPMELSQIDKSAVLSNFSALPLHLRDHLGLALARQFIRIDDANAARSVQGYMDRGGAVDPAAMNMIDAQLALAEDAVEAASPILETVVAEDGPDAAIALAELIENRSQAGLEISADLARSADALAVEYRGTDIGSRMVKASIRAYSVSGQPEVTFTRIDEAVAAGSISAEEARLLRAEAHLQSAARSGDVSFLRLVYQFPFPSDIGGAAESTARRAVARRLSDAGFPDRARQTLEPLLSNAGTEDNEILADIAMANGDPAQALTILSADPNLAKSHRVALAWERAGDLLQAEEIRSELGMKTEAQQLAERAGNWRSLLAAENPVLQDAARLALDELTESVPEGQNEGKPLAQARSLVDQSAQARRILSDLIETDRGS